LLPSWRFFAYVGPSPRIEIAWLERASDTPKSWQEYGPRPLHVSFGTMLWRLLWNPSWNESLYLVTCCERLLENSKAVAFWQNEIFMRLKSAKPAAAAEYRYLIFRIILIERHGDELISETAFLSTPREVEQAAT
jgi:hypothetical protein